MIYNMLHLHLIVLGKLKESYWQAAEAEYLKRLQPYAKIIIHELKEESFSEKNPVELVKKKEAAKITAELEKIKDGYIIALDEGGKKYSSPDFATNLQKQFSNYNNLAIFIVGGPLGLDPSILNQAHATISLSSFTFTHQMARVILLEQIYRGMMIANNRKYHY